MSLSMCCLKRMDTQEDRGTGGGLGRSALLTPGLPPTGFWQDMTACALGSLRSKVQEGYDSLADRV